MRHDGWLAPKVTSYTECPIVDLGILEGYSDRRNVVSATAALKLDWGVMVGNVLPIGLIVLMVPVEIICAVWLLKVAQPFVHADPTRSPVGWGDVGKLLLPLAFLLAALGVQLVGAFMIR